MYPILFRIGDAGLQSYTVALSLAFFIGLGIFWYGLKDHSVRGDRVINLSLTTFLAGLLGARILFILTQIPLVLSGTILPHQVWKGGVVFLGGFMAAVAWLYVAMPRFGIPRRLGFNAAAPAICFAHAMGRVGCFLNGCCFGEVCSLPWGVSYHDPLSPARPLETPLHPTQLYEALGLVILGFVLLRWNRRPDRRWSSAQFYLAAYGVLRFFLEFTRGDTMRGAWGPFSTSQWISLGMIIMAISLDLALRRRHNSRHESRT